MGDDVVTMDLSPGVSAQTGAEALEEDLKLVAAGHGWSLEEVRTRHEATEAVGRVAQRVAEEYPEVFVGSVAPEEPYGVPQLLIKGKADLNILTLAKAEGVPIEVVDGQPFSATALDGRIQDAYGKLKAMGFKDISVAADVRREGRLLANVRFEDGAPEAVGDIEAALARDFGPNLEVRGFSTPLGREHTAFGGMEVTDGGVFECTSGFTVAVALPFPPFIGTTTAGHCDGIDGIIHPGAGSHNFAFEEQHLGAWGDVEVHTSTAGHADDFYATSTTIRDVSGRELIGGISVGESVCLYSPQQASRFCAEVAFTSVSTRGKNRLVSMDQAVGIPGDSGGGWSFNRTAYGIEEGNGVVGGVFGDLWSVADYFDEALYAVVIN